MKKKQIRVRCWVDIDGVKFFGPGRAELLGLIEKLGSIAKAAKAMGMSYKKAWNMIEEMNARGQKPYVVASKGGQEGGGTVLTKTGKNAVLAYEKLLTDISLVLNENKELLKYI
jgi:molybdate transport system regulatory protein